MKLPYIVTAWAETHNRAAYLITDPRIIHFKQHLSFFLLPFFRSLLSGEWDKQANMNADHKSLSWSLNCLLSMLTKIAVDQVCVVFCLAGYGLVFPVYNQMWFTSPGPAALCIFKVHMHERLPAGICVVLCGDAATQPTKCQKTNQVRANRSAQQLTRQQSNWSATLSVTGAIKSIWGNLSKPAENSGFHCASVSTTETSTNHIRHTSNIRPWQQLI